MKRYPKLSHILPHLRQPLAGRSVEEELELLQAEASSGYAERLRQFASVRYYLRDFLFEISNKWGDRTSGVTNYAILIDQILQHNEGNRPICLVTFNYDLLLDRALVSFDYKPQTPENRFHAHPILKLFKPHGPVDWARLVDLPPTNKLDRDQLIASADTIRLTDEFIKVDSPDDADSFPRGGTAFPAIAIPFQNKTANTFECPPSHLTALEKLLPHITKILIIGWQAKEAHFLRMLQSKLSGLRKLMVVGKNTSDAHTILTHFLAETKKSTLPNDWFQAKDGFTSFVVTREAQQFLHA